MSQSVTDWGGRRPVERQCGQYKIYKRGNSLTVTIPRSLLFTAESVIIREAFYRDRIIYLKAVPLTAAVAGDIGTQRTTIIDGHRITEEKIDIYSVRQGEGEQLLTIPFKRSTTRFAKHSKPMIVSAHADNNVAYLKLLPEYLYDAANSIATSDLVEVEETTAIDTTTERQQALL